MHANDWFFDALFSSPHSCDYLVSIDDVNYTASSIKGMSLNRAVFTDKLSVGNCYSGELVLNTLIPSSAISRMAKILVFVRIKSATSAYTQYSNYITKGTYYIDTRKENSTWLEIHAYDAMLKAEQPFVANGILEANFPMTMTAAVTYICGAMGVSLDSRSTINVGAEYCIDYPNDMTMREVLGNIAAAHGGNFIINDDGNLQLLPLFPAQSVVTVNKSYRSLSTGTPFSAISRVTMWYDDENCFTCGDDTGYTFEIDCLYATQGICNAVYNILAGKTYCPYTVTGVQYNPRVELGDMITLTRGDGTAFDTAVVQCESIALNSGYVVTAAAPGDREIDHEYPYVSSTDKKLARTVKLGADYFGNSITREHGFVSELVSGGETVAKAVFNANELSLYKGSDRVLYFDTQNSRYVFSGTVESQGRIDAVFPASYDVTDVDLPGVYIYKNGSKTNENLVGSVWMLNEFSSNSLYISTSNSCSLNITSSGESVYEATPAVSIKGTMLGAVESDGSRTTYIGNISAAGSSTYTNGTVRIDAYGSNTNAGVTSARYRSSISVSGGEASHYMINISTGTFSVDSARIGFFGVTPVLRQQVQYPLDPSSVTSYELGVYVQVLATALNNLGLASAQGA